MDDYHLRRMEKDNLFQLYLIKGGFRTIDEAIARMEAIMEPKDVLHVKQTYAEMKKQNQ